MLDQSERRTDTQDETDQLIVVKKKHRTELNAITMRMTN